MSVSPSHSAITPRGSMGDGAQRAWQNVWRRTTAAREKARPRRPWPPYGGTGSRQASRRRSGDHRTRLVLHADVLRGVGRRMGALGEDHGHGLAAVPHLAVGENRPGGGRESAPLHRRCEWAGAAPQLVRGEDGDHAGPRAGAPGVDRANGRVRVGAPHKPRRPVSRGNDVVEKAPGPAQQTRFLEPLDAGARVPNGRQDVLHARRRPHAVAVAPPSRWKTTRPAASDRSAWISAGARSPPRTTACSSSGVVGAMRKAAW